MTAGGRSCWLPWSAKCQTLQQGLLAEMHDAAIRWAQCVFCSGQGRLWVQLSDGIHMRSKLCDKCCGVGSQMVIDRDDRTTPEATRQPRPDPSA